MLVSVYGTEFSACTSIIYFKYVGLCYGKILQEIKDINFVYLPTDRILQYCPTNEQSNTVTWRKFDTHWVTSLARVDEQS